MTTLRSIHEGVIERHYLRVPRPFDEDSCGHCRHEWPCADYSDAVAALAALDAADIAWRFYGNPGTCSADKIAHLAKLKGAEILGRVVPDPVSGRDEP